LIGLDQLLEVILGQVSAPFFSVACKGYDLENGELWRHSVACALLPRIIAKRLNREVTSAHFTAALLHDIGKILLSQYVQDYSDDIKRIAREGHLSFIEAEKKILGIDHAEVGSWVIEQWTFPKVIVSAVQYHHTPFLAPENHEFVQLIYLCDLVSMITGIGGGADGLSYHAYGEVMKQYNLKEKDIEQFMIQLDSQFRMVEGVLNLGN
jgi:putative nucleotidyltransferase with HDIG domain